MRNNNNGQVEGDTRIVTLGNGQRLANRSGMIVSEEQALGQEDRPILRMSRLSAPEDANADRAAISVQMWQEASQDHLPAIVPLRSFHEMGVTDYSSLSNMQYLRDAVSTMGALGRADQQAVALVQDDADTWSSGRIVSPNLILGFLIRWSMVSQGSTMFELGVSTHNFINLMGADVNRNFTVNIGVTKGQNAGAFAFLFANREATNSAYYYNANASLSQAIVQLAYIFERVQASEDTPNVAMEVPATIGAIFSATMRPLTVGSQALAVTLQRLQDMVRFVNE